MCDAFGVQNRFKADNRFKLKAQNNEKYANQGVKAFIF